MVSQGLAVALYLGGGFLLFFGLHQYFRDNAAGQTSRPAYITTIRGRT